MQKFEINYHQINKPYRKMVGGNAYKGIDRKAVIKVPKEKYKIYQKLLKSRGFKGKIKAVSLK